MGKKQQYAGLTDGQVAESRRQYGENVLTPPQREPLWRKFLAKFSDPLIVILLVAGVLSIGISFYEFLALGEGHAVFFEPVGIFIAILLATGLAFLFEYKADREFALLNQVNDDEPVQVFRNGEWHQIAKREVVVGDIVRLETGMEIPADGTLIESTTLMVDESSLTGEPVAEKAPLCPGPEEASLSLHPEEGGQDVSVDGSTYPAHIVLRGTKVMEGYGIFQVDHVGDATENGKVFTAAQIDDSVKTPLNEQLERLGSLISKLSYLIASLVVVARLADFLLTEPFSLVSFIAYVLQTVMIAVTLIVVAVPEGLPMAVTLSLAYSMRRMLKTNNLVRKMHACETMGAATVICTDKTGTLTQNRMTVEEMFVVAHPQPLPKGEDGGRLSLYQNIAVNSTAELSGGEVIGNPTEGALLLWLREQGADYQELRRQMEIVAQEPFNTERKYMTTTVRSALGSLQGKTPQPSPLNRQPSTVNLQPSARPEAACKARTFLKGAPEIVLSKCRLSEEERERCNRKLAEWQSKAMRTLAFADGDSLQALVAISDPVRPDVPAAVRECLDAGIDVKIVTGDTIGTATEIARQVGVVNEECRMKNEESSSFITGPELAALSDEELRERAKDLKVIARARPMDKKRLVEALQARGEVVAVTGDGTNDAPALKVAHVGLSMGDGTSVAKEASDITIIDNSFSSIGRAVMWGRSLYRNIQRFILFQMTVNVVACLIVFVGALFDTQSPLSVTQMLWVNLIMDTFAAMALASLPPSEQVMKERPRDRSRFIISRPMKQFILVVGLTFTVVLMVFFIIFENTPGDSVVPISETVKKGFSLREHSLFFTIFVMLQFWNLFNAKSFLTGKSAFHQLGESKEFLFIVMLIFIGQVLIVQFGGAMFNVEALSLRDWLLITVNTSVVFLFGELYRMIRKGIVRH